MTQSLLHAAQAGQCTSACAGLSSCILSAGACGLPQLRQSARCCFQLKLHGPLHCKHSAAPAASSRPTSWHILSSVVGHKKPRQLPQGATQSLASAAAVQKWLRWPCLQGAAFAGMRYSSMGENVEPMNHVCRLSPHTDLFFSPAPLCPADAPPPPRSVGSYTPCHSGGCPVKAPGSADWSDAAAAPDERR